MLRIIQDRAGVDLRILDGEKEAFFSLEAVYATYKFRQRAEWSGDLSENDAILLLDQGGGSTEISCLSPTREGFMMKFQSFDQLGTTALRDRFFTTGKDGRIDPAANRNRVSTQNQRIRGHIRDEIEKWGAYPELAGKHILPYAMGSAVTECFKCNSYSLHNRCLTVDRMLEISDQRCSEIDNSTQWVSTLHGELAATPGFKTNNLDGVLTQLYGLPVYRGFLEKLGLDHLFLCGYGLRYGVYSHVCIYHQPLPG